MNFTMRKGRSWISFSLFGIIIAFFIYLRQANCPALRRFKKPVGPVDPDYLRKRREALRRTHREAVSFNDDEIAAIKKYCEQFKVRSKAAFFRELIMEKVISGLEDNHPTLF